MLEGGDLAGRRLTDPGRSVEAKRASLSVGRRWTPTRTAQALPPCPLLSPGRKSTRKFLAIQANAELELSGRAIDFEAAWARPRQ